MSAWPLHPGEIILAELRRQGLWLAPAGQDLVVKPQHLLTPELCTLIRTHKDPIRTALALEALTLDERYVWEERIGICLYDGEMSEADAESVAWQQIQDWRTGR
ncbi:MAG: hypothetical protein WCI73_10905 [Phycisphaerae bacterium]